MRKILLTIAIVLVWAVPASAQDTAVACGQNAQGLAGDPGATIAVTCPAGCGGGTVWGTMVYSDDSAICAAAIHAGVLTPAGGTAIVTILPGQEAYPASTMNGITTSEWGSWSRSFSVTPATSAVECTQNAQTLAGDPGTVHTVTCPAGCTGGSVWGAGVYSDDSAVCLAAVHAGVITAAEGGAVVVTIAPGQEAYPSTTANGVTTSEWGSWSRSFTVAAP